MRKKKLISRVAAAITTITLLLTSIPLGSLTAFADDGGGSGGGETIGNGSITHVYGEDALNDENVGIRISLVTLKDGGPRVVKNAYGTYYFDIWDAFWVSGKEGHPGGWSSMTPSYEFVNSETRYTVGLDGGSAVATKGNITRTNAFDFDNVVNKWYAAAGYNTNVDLTHLLQPGRSCAASVADKCNHWLFTEWGGPFSVSGQNFYNYFMEKCGTVNGKERPVYEVVMNYLYEGCTTGLNPENTFMVVEPVVSLCNVYGTSDTSNDWKALEDRYVSSWYGYLEHNIANKRDPGRAHTIRNRLKKLGNDFRLAFTAYTTNETMRAKITEVLGVAIPSTSELYTDYGSDTSADKSTQWFGCGIDADGDGKEDGGRKRYNNIHRKIGLGMEAFWLKGSIDPVGTPIDTYDIINQTQNEPTPPETPSTPDSSSSTGTPSSDDSVNTSGEKTIIKLYADLYKDPNTSYYTEIIDTAEFVMTNTSNMVTITDEENINGYKLSAWYTSGTKYDASNTKNNALLKASNMMNISDMAALKSDGNVFLNELGGQQLRINSYQAAYKDGNGYNVLSKDSGGQKYYTKIDKPHGSQGKGVGAQVTGDSPYTTKYKRLETKGTSNYGEYNFPVFTELQDTANKPTIVDIDKAETIVLLYTRERTHISTSDLTSSSTSDSSTTITIKDEDDDRIDKSGPLTIVKLYGIINPNTYEITADPSKATVVAKNATRNVNINSESGYTFAEWIYTTQGAPTDLTASEMGETNLGTVLLDKTLDQAYRLDGFVDGFKNNKNFEKYFRFLNGTTLQRPVISVVPSGSGVNNNATAGRYSYGSRSGIGTGSYNSTLYLGGDKLADKTPDETDTNDVLYLLFLKTDQLSYSADDLVIPESYITRYDNYKHNPMTVTGSVSGVAYEEYLQAHKFKYILPVVTTASEYIDVNPLFMPHIALVNKSQAGLVSDKTSVQRLGLTQSLGHEVIKAYTTKSPTGISDYARLMYVNHGYTITSTATGAKQYTGNILNVSSLNIEYTAFRNGDTVQPAIWKYNKLASLTSSKPLMLTDTSKVYGEIAFRNPTTALKPLFDSSVISSAGSSRKPNNTSQNFKLNFDFSEVGDGIKSLYLSSSMPTVVKSNTEMYNVDQPRKISISGTSYDLFKASDSFFSYSHVGGTATTLSRAEAKDLGNPELNAYAIHSLNRLFRIRNDEGKWVYRRGITRYLDSISDVSIEQNVQYEVHYGSDIANTYKDKVESGNGTDNVRGQYGYVRSMKANNTITFYPYHVMQYEFPESYNAELNKDGTLKSKADIVSGGLSNNANQIYVMGEEARQLNVYDYAEVSYFGHSVASSKGVDVVNNVVNTNRKGRIEISSEQWSTHARSNSLIGLSNCALPGGATLSITIPAANRQTVTVTSYSALLPTVSAGYAQVKAYENLTGDTGAFGNVPTDTTVAAERHNKLVESVAAGLEGLNVEQYFSGQSNAFTNTKDGGENYDSNNTVYNQIKNEIPSGSNLYSAKSSSKVYSVTDFTGKEDKYYYRPDGDVKFVAGKASAIKFGDYTLATGNNQDGNGNTGDFDTDYEEKVGTSTQTYYTFYMNRIGQVLCIKSSNTSESVRANMTGLAVGDNAVVVASWVEGGYKYTTTVPSDVKLAAQNTGIVEELYKQLEEGTGNDESTPWSKSNGEWYFEAFDGLTIAKFETKLSVGFIDPYERTSVLDPEVVPSMNSKGDIITSSVMSQVVTSDTSTMYGTANKIGEYCDESGNKLGDIVMPDLRSFFISDIFFAPNVTVQDLK